MTGLKLNLGCGDRKLPGYLHIDVVDYPHIDVVSDVKRLPMFTDETASIIYAAHILEHLYEDDARLALLEWYRILEPGGILRLAVPDFDALVSVYLKSGELSHVLGPLYGSYLKSRKVIDKHKTVYNTKRLSKLLINCGYKNVRSWDWRSIFVDELSGFDDYSQAYIPHMNKASGKLISLNIEAEK